MVSEIWIRSWVSPAGRVAQPKPPVNEGFVHMENGVCVYVCESVVCERKNDKGNKTERKRDKETETRESLVFLSVELKQGVQDVQPNYFLCLADVSMCVWLKR